MTNNGHISTNGIFGALEAWRLHLALFVVVTEKLKWGMLKCHEVNWFQTPRAFFVLFYMLLIRFNYWK